MCKCLEVDSVMKSFGDEDVLTDIYLSCKPGDRIGIFGWNGCGKSTLLKIIFGTLKGDRSFIRINGMVQKKQAYLSGQIAYLPQDNFLPPNLLVREAVQLYINEEKRNDFLNDMHLDYMLDSYIKELSGGEQRYLEIKLILFSRAPYILLDEPFNGLSPVSCESIRKCILEVSQMKGIILTDHNFREVHKIVNRILFLKEGYLREIKDVSELTPYGYYK